MRRHSGYRSVLVSTQATFGQTDAACARNSSSGAVYSWAASETSSTASARGQRGHRRRAVHRLQPADAGGVDQLQARRPAPAAGPRPRRGSSPPGCRGCPARRRARRARRPAPRSARSPPLGPAGRPAPDQGDRHRRRRAARRSGTAVATSSNVGHTGAPTSPLTSMLLPCLNSPTTSTRTRSSSSRERAWRQPGVEVGAVVAGDGGQRPVDDRQRFGAVHGCSSHGQCVGVVGGEVVAGRVRGSSTGLVGCVVDRFLDAVPSTSAGPRRRPRSPPAGVPPAGSPGSTAAAARRARGGGDFGVGEPIARSVTSMSITSSSLDDVSLSWIATTSSSSRC